MIFFTIVLLNTITDWSAWDLGFSCVSHYTMDTGKGRHISRRPSESVLLIGLTLRYLSLKDLPVLRKVGTQDIVDNALLGNAALAFDFETLYDLILEQSSSLNLSQTSKRFSEFVQGNNIFVLAPIGLIVFSAPHGISSLSGGSRSADPFKYPSNSLKNAPNLFH